MILDSVEELLSGLGYKVQRPNFQRIPVLRITPGAIVWFSDSPWYLNLTAPTATTVVLSVRIKNTSNYYTATWNSEYYLKHVEEWDRLIEDIHWAHNRDGVM